MGACCSYAAPASRSVPSGESLRALLQAIADDDADGFKRLAALHPSLLAVKAVSDGRTALQAAIVHERVDLVVFLLSHGLIGVSTIRSRDAAGNSALDLAAWLRATRIVHMLVLAGSVVERCPGQRGWTPLHVSAFLDDAEVASVLCGALRAAGRECPASDTGDSPLHVAARRHARRAGAAIVLAGGVPPEARNGRGRTALHVACIHGALAMVQLLCPPLSGLLDALDGAGMSALHYAAHVGHAGACRCLLDGGAAVGIAGAAGATPVYFAAEGGHAAVVRLLLAAFPDAQSRRADLLRRAGPNSWTALHAAAARGAARVITALLEAELEGVAGEAASADARVLVDAVDREGRTALLLASAADHAGAVRELLRFGASNPGPAASELTTPERAAAGLLQLRCAREPPPAGDEQPAEVHDDSVTFDPPVTEMVQNSPSFGGGGSDRPLVSESPS